MNPDRLEQRKNSAPEPPHIIVIGKLIDYKPRFSRYSTKNRCGVLDIVKEKDSIVFGIIYGIKRQHLYLIDEAEGAPYAYRRFKINVKIDRIIDDDFFNTEFSIEEYLNCYCYEVRKKSPEEIPPSRDYYNHIKVGHDRYGVNIDLINEIISRIGYSEDVID